MRQSNESPVERHVGDGTVSPSGAISRQAVIPGAAIPGATSAAEEVWTPVEGAWSQSAPWSDSSARSRRLGIAVGGGLALLACLALVGATTRVMSRATPEVACASAAECHELGLRYAAGGSVDADPALAGRFFQRACDQGHAAGCNRLGLAYQTAAGVPQDYARAMAYFGRACSAGFAEACSNQGTLYEHGQGVPVNLGDAQRLYTQACRRGSALGCSNLGVLYAEGRGVLVNGSEAGRLFAEACGQGSVVGCQNLLVPAAPTPPSN
jgi:TPR repeat protein